MRHFIFQRRDGSNCFVAGSVTWWRAQFLLDYSFMTNKMEAEFQRILGETDSEGGIHW